MTNDLDFADLVPIELPLSIAGGQYVLREATGDAACRYRNAQLRETKLGPDGKPTALGAMTDTEPLLVSLCLFEMTGNPPTARPVKIETVRAWPYRVQKALFEKIKAISLLDEAAAETADTLAEKISVLQERQTKLTNGHAEEPAKNSPGFTTAGSRLLTS